MVAISDKRYALKPHDFGLVPFGAGHAWRNPSNGPERVLRGHAPQPRPIGGRGSSGVFSAPETAVPVDGQPVDELDPAKPFAGHFDQSDMAPPGSISMPGYHGANLQNVQIRMMVDELRCAASAMFIVKFKPTLTGRRQDRQGALPPVRGDLLPHLGSDTEPATARPTARGVGDLIFAPVGASHGFAPISEEPLCWVEVQHPSASQRRFHLPQRPGRHTNIG
jgi:mannose-6-phosphate isomerase-like protein (cupin superfamily)